MIKSKLYTFLKEYLGEYLYGLQEDQLDVALLSGVINFTNANFRPDKVNSLFADQSLPFTLKAGLIGSLQVKYHYASMLSNPVEVTVDTLLIVLGPLLCQTGEPDTRYLESSLAEENVPADKIFLKRFARDKRKRHQDSSEELSDEDGEDEFASQQDSLTDTPMKASALFAKLADSPAEKSEGLLARYFTKVLKNLTLKVTNVHIRYEDDTYLYNNPFSGGVILKSLAVRTTPQEWAFASDDSSQTMQRPPSHGAIAKEVSLSNLSLYLFPLSSMLIPTSLWEATQSSPIGIFDALPAYEVRELAIQEAESIVAEGGHTVVSPISTAFTITLGNDFPKVKACVPLGKTVEVRITAAMVDTVRGFLDYHTNVKMWPFMRRYRPFERVLLIHRSEDEPDFVSAKRKRIVRKWFIYACRFIQAKRKILELIRRKKRQVSKEKTEMRKKERYVREPEVENSVDVSSSFLMNESLRTDSPDATSILPQNVKKAMSFLIIRPRRIPGLSTSNLSAAVNEYNKSLLTSPTRVSIKARNPDPPKPRSAHFKPPFNSCEVDVRAVGIVLIVSDERLRLKCVLDRVYSSSKIESDTLRQRVGIGCCTASIGDGQEESVVLKVGKKEVVKEEVVKGGLFSRGQKRSVVLENAEQALAITLTYVPSAFRASGELHPSANMYEVGGTMAQVNLWYSHTIVMQVIDLLDELKEKKSQEGGGSEGEEVEKKKKTQLSSKERDHNKRRKVRHASALVAFASEALAKKILLLKNKLHRTLKETDDLIDPISFSFKLDFGGLNFSLTERDSSSPWSDIYFPTGKFELVKVETRLKVLMWGFGITTESNLGGLESFVKVSATQAAEVITEEKMRKWKRGEES